jgi:hypothetical protein
LRWPRLEAAARRRKLPFTLHTWVSGLAYGLPHVPHFTETLAFGAILVRPRRRARLTQTWVSGLL